VTYNAAWYFNDFSTSTTYSPNTALVEKYTTGTNGYRYIYVNDVVSSGANATPAARAQTALNNYIGTDGGGGANSYSNHQLYNLYIYSTSLAGPGVGTDQTLIEATPYTFTALPNTITLTVASITATNFVLSTSTVTGANQFVVFVNGSATYTSATGLTALSNVTLTPNTPGPWALNVYAYNSGYSLLASGVGTATLYATASKSANSGATITTNGAYTVFTYTNGGTFTVASSGYGSVLLVAGGGGGGGDGGGGGGGGGVIYQSNFMIPSGANSISVGSGGTGANATLAGNGGNTTAFGLTAIGGGGGAGNHSNSNGANGGSGGGSFDPSYPPGAGTGGQGFSGGTVITSNVGGGGGGGGAGGVGGTGSTSTSNISGGNGGPGFACSITGTSVYYGGGGGGGCWSSAYATSPASGGTGGGGNGGNPSTNPTAGTNGLGGGGGGGKGTSNGANGGNGVVIIFCYGTA